MAITDTYAYSTGHARREDGHAATNAGMHFQGRLHRCQLRLAATFIRHSAPTTQHAHFVLHAMRLED